MRVDWDRARRFGGRGVFGELHFWWLCGGMLLGRCLGWWDVQWGLLPLTNWVLGTEGEFEPVYLVLVQWVVVQDSDVHLPFFEVLGFDDCDPRRKMILHLVDSVILATGNSDAPDISIEITSL